MALLDRIDLDEDRDLDMGDISPMDEAVSVYMEARRVYERSRAVLFAAGYLYGRIGRVAFDRAEELSDLCQDAEEDWW